MKAIYRFGAHCLIPEQRLLLHGEEPVHIGSRAFAILVVLVERAGSVVSAQELMQIAWPDVVVEEANLRVQIGTLRKILGAGTHGRSAINTVPLRGYCFVLPVDRASAYGAERTVETVSQHNLPSELTTTIGRDDTIGLLAGMVGSRRLITITGPGGIGKTTVALAVARKCLQQFRDGVRFVDLSPVMDEKLVVTALASRLGIGVLSSNPVEGLLTRLAGRQLLLVLDTCEHVVAAVAVLGETLLANLPDIRILATSREPLRAAGEWVHRLQPLEMPPEGAELSAAVALGFPAVSLFVQRVSATVEQFELRDADTQVVGAICRALDGIPLAIEFAAAQVEEMGLREVAARLNDRFSILTRGRRTALPRHQTLAAALEWSYDLLPEQERTILRHLSVFRGPFIADAAQAVAMFDMGKQQAAAALSNLHAKSLITADIGAEVVLYRLLDTTRAFAAQKSVAAQEREAARRRHAEFLLVAAHCSEAEWESRDSASWTARFGYLIEDARAGLEWAFSADGDPQVGIELVASSSILWFALSLLEEYREHLERALAAFAAGVPARPAAQIRLWDGLGHALWHTRGDMPGMAAAFSRVWDLADRENLLADKLRALWGRLVCDNTNGDYADSLVTLERFRQLVAATDDPRAHMTYRRMAALGMHYAGHHDIAKEHAEYVLQHSNTPGSSARQTGLQFDSRIAALSILARIHWLQGQPELARANALEGLQLSQSMGHALSECFLLATAVVPIALWSNDFAMAESMNDLLLARTREHGFGIWHAFGRSYEAVLARRNNPSVQLPGGSSVGQHLAETLATFDESLADDALLERGVLGLAGWCTPELLRIRAQRAVARGEPAEFVRTLLSKAAEVARTQGAIYWQNRAAANLA